MKFCFKWTYSFLEKYKTPTKEILLKTDAALPHWLKNSIQRVRNVKCIISHIYQQFQSTIMQEKCHLVNQTNVSEIRFAVLLLHGQPS